MDAEENEGHAARLGDEPIGALFLAAAAILEGLPDAVVAASDDGRIVFVNALAEQLFGYPREELVGQPVATLWPERVRERYSRMMELYFANEHPLRFAAAAWGRRRDGSEFVGEMSWGIVGTNVGPLLLAVGRDISERRAAEQRLRALAAMGERALAGASPTDLAGEAIELLRDALPATRAEVRLRGDDGLASEPPGADVGVHLPIGDGDKLIVTTARTLADDEMSFVRAVANILATALARVRDEERIRHEALHDPLTGAANRTLLRDRLEHAIARSERGGSETGVMFVDLDNFKQVNDCFGHAAGDGTLVEIARRLRMAVRPADTVARLGGDEFVVVCEEVDKRSALALGRRLQDAIELPLAVGGAEHRLSVSIGIALGHQDPEMLLGNADIAVYRAKAVGGGRVLMFE
jgi:diguanylate cyclase (GGDEF)-like protein/PAS domain S-box-containing protein